jgi:2-keto-3-deoxy-L-rhamnonate aldolase RhmA
MTVTELRERLQEMERIEEAGNCPVYLDQGQGDQLDGLVEVETVDFVVEQLDGLVEVETVDFVVVPSPDMEKTDGVMVSGDFPLPAA